MDSTLLAVEMAMMLLGLLQEVTVSITRGTSHLITLVALIGTIRTTIPKRKLRLVEELSV